MSRSFFSSILLLATLVSVGCALGTGSGSRGGMRDIQIDELRGAEEDNLLDLIERARPSWLFSHNLRDPGDPNETAGPLVMVNDVPPRPLFTLQYIAPASVIRVEYLTSTYAMNRYRVNSPSGVILVTTPPLVGPPPDTGLVNHIR